MDTPDTQPPQTDAPELTADQVVKSGAFAVQNMIAQGYVSLFEDAVNTNEREKAELQAQHEKEVAELKREAEQRERENIERMALLINKANRDNLTGLFNREAAVEAYEGMQNHHKRHPQTDTERRDRVLFFDLDGFKELNDTQSHKAGDEMLKVFAKILNNSGRPGDLAFRIGGDEFLMIVPGVTSERALDIATAVREDTADTKLVTVSVGIAEANTAGTFEEFKADADTAMYEAKAQGKNAIVEFQSAA